MKQNILICVNFLITSFIILKIFFQIIVLVMLLWMFWSDFSYKQRNVKYYIYIIVCLQPFYAAQIKTICFVSCIYFINFKDTERNTNLSLRSMSVYIHKNKNKLCVCVSHICCEINLKRVWVRPCFEISESKAVLWNKQ